MRLRFRVPRESEGIDHLAEMARGLGRAVQTLAEMIGSADTEHPRLLEAMHALEGRSNELFFRLLTTMRSSIVNRLPREDLYRAGESLNGAVEALVSAGDVVVTLSLTHPSPRSSDLLEIIQRLADNSLKAFLSFENLDDLEDIWVDSLRLSKRAEHTRLAWLRDVIDSGSSSAVNKEGLLAERLMMAIAHVRDLTMRIGEIVVRES